MIPKNSILISIFCCFCSFFWLQNTNAQDSCQIAFVNATEAFSLGEYEKVILLLENKVNKCDFSKETKLQILKMLSASYSETDRIEEAEKKVNFFLHNSPVYQLQGTDPQSFISVFEKFSVQRKLSLGIELGLNTPNIQILKSYNIWDADNYNSSYTRKTTLLVKLCAQWHFNNKLSLNLETGISNNSFQQNINYGDTYALEISEKTFYVQTPLYLSYQIFTYKKFSLNILAGAFFQENLKNSFTYNFSGKNIISKSGDGNFNNRNTYAYGLISGLAVNYRKNRLSYFISNQYSYSFSLYNIPAKRYSTPEKNFSLIKTDDDLRLSAMYVSFGIFYDLFFKIKHKYR